MTKPEISTRGWYKSSYSAQATECVETGRVVSSGMAVRDSKDPNGPALLFPAAAWSSFVTSIKTGEFPNT
ncbi:DUF397 domain-containing protein [Streptomyces rubellomurinus]|uniref:DUF397 domain-containing protein n=1 Tax=Streptomyces rubellomurinus (strain ATCC 31215) TaxID=359131 RepID=A0A0F2T4H1_STRR3|nr:DUF397 domain-containing protein [Streptomyces rubellomurinus]KJS58114.1 hypothetical protein VM95_35415 [Streptomyces rubellomurinus]